MVESGGYVLRFEMRVVGEGECASISGVGACLCCVFGGGGK